MNVMGSWMRWQIVLWVEFRILVTKCHLALACRRLADQTKQGGSEVERGSQQMRLFTPDKLTVRCSSTARNSWVRPSDSLNCEPHDFPFATVPFLDVFFLKGLFWVDKHISAICKSNKFLKPTQSTFMSYRNNQIKVQNPCAYQTSPSPV